MRRIALCCDRDVVTGNMSRNLNRPRFSASHQRILAWDIGYVKVQ